MRILVLGGTAFLSAAFTRVALQRGHQVSCLARGSQREPPRGADWYRADRDSGAAAYQQAEGEWDGVVEVSWQPRHVREALAALAPRTAHWSYVSSCSVYADNSSPGADESAELLTPYQGEEAVTAEQYGEAKVACEAAVLDVLGDRAHLSRAGLIVGPGDPTDRFGYWPARFARAGNDPVLVPAAAVPLMQVIDVADLAGWMLHALETGTAGIFNAVGDPRPVTEIFELAQQVAGHRAAQVRIDHDWLIEQQVNFWAGPESLPLWLPADHRGFGARSNAAAKQHGLTLTPPEPTMVQTLAAERELGLDRERRAGLSPAREAELLEAWAGSVNSVVSAPDDT